LALVIFFFSAEMLAPVSHFFFVFLRSRLPQKWVTTLSLGQRRNRSFSVGCVEKKQFEKNSN